MASYPTAGRRAARPRRMSEAEMTARMSTENIRKCIDALTSARPGSTGRTATEEATSLATYRAELQSRGEA